MTGINWSQEIICSITRIGSGGRWHARIVMYIHHKGEICCFRNYRGSTWRRWLWKSIDCRVRCRRGNDVVVWLEEEEKYQYYRKCTVRRTHIHEHDLFENQVLMIVTSQYKWSIAPGSFWWTQASPPGQSGRPVMSGSRNPFCRSRIHQSLRPQKNTSAAHKRQIRVREPEFGPRSVAILWRVPKASESCRNPVGWDWRYVAICTNRQFKFNV